METTTTLSKEQVIGIILSGHKRIVEYYTYPTGGYGMDNEIFRTDNYNSNKYDEPMRNIITLIVQLGAAAAGYSSQDNKTAVKVIVEGLDFPVYFVKYDCKYTITREIKPESEGKPVNWSVG